MKKSGISVLECNRQSSNRLIDYVLLLKKCITLKFDIILIGARGDYYGQPLVPLIRRLCRKPIIFDSVITLYETQVIDRRLFGRKSLKSFLLYALDYMAFKSADLVFSDTITHTEYYARFYNLPKEKTAKIPIGSDDEFFYPRKTPKCSDSFVVLFWGGFIPLQGVKYIIRAAKLLEGYPDIKFELLGNGQEYSEAIELSKTMKTSNVTFRPNWVPYNDLPNYIAKADVCLGIFGDTEKAKRVIPNKVVESLAMRKPLITGDSPAARELLKDKENCLLVQMANPRLLADGILKLRDDECLRQKIAKNGYYLYLEMLSPEAIGGKLKYHLIKLVNQQDIA